MAHDIVIVGGSVIDGTGSAATQADVAISGDRIVEVGKVDASGAGQVIEADGRIVTPGFVDIHSHLDAQVGWDPLMTSSCWHGVTSVVMGNCGMTFAPVRPGKGDVLATAMESVEDIPASCILDGLPWDWETYGEYLDTIDKMPRGLNAGGFVGDVALRLYVAGDAACEPDFKASPEQLSEMAALVTEALEAGALGYSISRSLFHRVPDGRNVPGTWSDPSEFFEIARPLQTLNKGVLESAPRYNEEHTNESRVAQEVGWMAEMSRELGRPFTFNLQQIESLGDHYQEVMALATQANAAGSQLHPQITPRSVGVLFSLAANTLIDDLPSWSKLAPLDLAGRLDGLRDEALRLQLIEEGKHKPVDPFERMFLMDASEQNARYNYSTGDSIAAIARARGCSPTEAYIWAMLDSDGRSIVNWPVMNQREDAIAELITNDVTIIGLADSGAHATQIMDASQPTYFISHWARDEGLISIEEAVRQVTSSTANFIGYRDRGVLRPGAFADINVIDLEGLSLDIPEIRNDFPGGAKRFVQKARGIEHTFVNGQHFMAGGEHTGALAGTLIRT